MIKCLEDRNILRTFVKQNLKTNNNNKKKRKNGKNFKNQKFNNRI